jgi:hypothetical protein
MGKLVVFSTNLLLKLLIQFFIGHIREICFPWDFGDFFRGVTSWLQWISTANPTPIRARWIAAHRNSSRISYCIIISVPLRKMLLLRLRSIIPIVITWDAAVLPLAMTSMRISSSTSVKLPSTTAAEWLLLVGTMVASIKVITHEFALR